MHHGLLFLLPFKCILPPTLVHCLAVVIIYDVDEVGFYVQHGGGAVMFKIKTKGTFIHWYLDMII